MVMIVAGIDIGSVSAKVVWKSGNEIFYHMMPTSWNLQETEKKLLAGIREKSGRAAKPDFIIATGYGRVRCQLADKTLTEIQCHARGVRFFYPDAGKIIDIGGQDSKVIGLDAAGNVCDFVMNDKCAAGTGRFLEVMAQRLDEKLEDFSCLAEMSQAPAAVTSMCTVFAESEIIGLLARGICKEDVAAGLYQAIATRTAALTDKIAGGSPLIFTGGLSRHRYLQMELERKLGQPVLVAEHGVFTGALGAALAAEEYGKRKGMDG